jgi:hypothetical protein
MDAAPDRTEAAPRSIRPMIVAGSRPHNTSADVRLRICSSRRLMVLGRIRRSAAS